MNETPNPWAEKMAELESNPTALDKEVAKQTALIDSPVFRTPIDDFVNFAEAVESHADTLKKIEKPKNVFGQEIPKRGIDEYGDMKWRHVAAGIDDAGIQHRRDYVNTTVDRQYVKDRMKQSAAENKDSVAAFGYWVLDTFFDNPEDIPVEAFKAFLQFGVYLKLKASAEREAGRPIKPGISNPFREQPLDAAPQFQPQRDGKNSPLQELITRHRVSDQRPSSGPIQRSR